LRHPSPSNPWIRILKGNHHPSDACPYNSLGTGGGAAVVTAGFEGDDKSSASRSITGLRQGTHLSMGFTSSRMKAFPHQTTLLIENNSSHEGIRAGVSIGKGSQRQRPPHPGIPHQLKGKS
jgi:hypothetical protein